MNGEDPDFPDKVVMLMLAVALATAVALFAGGILVDIVKALHGC